MAVNTDLSIFRRLVTLCDVYKETEMDLNSFQINGEKLRKKYHLIGGSIPPGSVILIFNNYLTCHVFRKDNDRIVVVMDNCCEPKILCVVRVNDMIQPLYGDVEDIIPKLQEVLS